LAIQNRSIKTIHEYMVRQYVRWLGLGC